MGQVHPAERVALVIGMLAAREAVLAEAESALAARCGAVALRSETWPFDFTRYYEPAMGPGLLRRFVALRDLIDPAELATLKLATQEIEAAAATRHAAPGAPPRPLNLDPGYLALGKLVLASTKDHAHRIYLGRGIYAEVTLFFRDGEFHPHAWTYPDYRTPAYHAFFHQVRDSLRGRDRSGAAGDTIAS